LKPQQNINLVSFLQVFHKSLDGVRVFSAQWKTQAVQLLPKKSPQDQAIAAKFSQFQLTPRFARWSFPNLTMLHIKFSR